MIAPPSDRELQSLRDRFGEGISARFLPDGRLASVRGNLAGGLKEEAGFSSRDPQRAIARAKEILRQLSGELGLEPGLPLGNATAQTGIASVQVYFTEMQRGLPIAPFGSVTVNLGAHGELVGLDSDYVPGVPVASTADRGPAAARDAALGAAPPRETSGKIEGGRTLIWVDSAGPHPAAQRAYEYMIEGRQIVVDAASGKVLFQRDRRVF